MIHKLCLVCSSEMSKPKKYSLKQWERKKYCSPKCQHEHQKDIFSGKHFSKASEFKKGVNSGKGNNSWKTGKYMQEGYVMVWTENRGHVQEHRLVMEGFLGRELDSREIIHHINHDRADNRIENLQVMSQSEHAKIHTTERWNQLKKKFNYLPYLISI